MNTLLFLSVMLLSGVELFQATGIIANDLKRFGIDYSFVEAKLKQRNRPHAMQADSIDTTDTSNDHSDHSEVSVNRHISNELFESDILLTPAQAVKLTRRSNRRLKRAMMRDFENNRWDPLNVPYIIDESISDEALSVIQEGIAHWEENSCIRFNQSNVTADDTTILFFAGAGCYSYVGKIAQFQLQPISIGYGCEWLGTVIHEIGHALGFFHEQSRTDRDDHVEIIWGNIEVDKWDNFEKYDSTFLIDLGVSYDYRSIMHYPGTAFSINGGNTIVTMNNSYQDIIGQRTGLSLYDITEMNIVYCNWSPSSSSTRNTTTTSTTTTEPYVIN